jgi:hypothetical protein
MTTTATLGPVRRLFFEQGYSHRFLRDWVIVTSWIVGVGLALTLLVGGIVGINRHADVTKCRNTAQRMHREYKSGWLEGCLVRLDDGSYIPLSNLRVQDIERGR